MLALWPILLVALDTSERYLLMLLSLIFTGCSLPVVESSRKQRQPEPGPYAGQKEAGVGDLMAGNEAEDSGDGVELMLSHTVFLFRAAREASNAWFSKPMSATVRPSHPVGSDSKNFTCSSSAFLNSSAGFLVFQHLMGHAVSP